MNLREIKFNFQNVLAIFIIICCFSILVIAMRTTKVENPHIAEVRTIAGSILIVVIQYYFGSSKGSKTKDETIAKTLNDASDNQNSIH